MTSSLPRVGPWVAGTAAGVFVMVGAGVTASRYSPPGFDPDDGPAHPAVPPAVWWGLEAVGLALVLAGLLRTGWLLRRAPAPRVPHPAPAWAEVAAGALAGAVVGPIAGLFALVGVLLSEQAVPAAVTVFWLAHAAAVTGLQWRTVPQPTAARGWCTGLVVGALAVVVVVGWVAALRGPVEAVPVVDGAAVALALLVRRAAAGGVRPWRAATGVLGVLGAAAVVVVGASTAADRVDRAAPSSEPRPSPRAAAPAPAAPGPSSPPAPAGTPVDPRVACAPAELAWSTTGWDAAMGTRAVTVVATSRADHPCYLDGTPGVAIAQGGRELRLTTEPTAGPGPAGRVGLAPGGSASFPLIWAGHGAAADADTPQELRVVVDDGDPSTVPLGAGPAPFDLVDGATIEVGPWRAFP